MPGLMPILATVGNATGDAARAVTTSAETTPVAEALTRTRYELARVESFSEWWQMPLLVLVCVVVLVYVAYLYRRDSVELKPGIGFLLMFLRLAAFCGILLAYLDVQKRTETKVVHNSRVLLLVDTSLSMARADADESTTGAPSLRAASTTSQPPWSMAISSINSAIPMTCRWPNSTRSCAATPRCRASRSKPMNS